MRNMAPAAAEAPSTAYNVPPPYESISAGISRRDKLSNMNQQKTGKISKKGRAVNADLT
ncbi:hypothetical protein [Lentibacillus sp. CBA3610]|uniref:hypothetical protein n=1 Tax=Lentibacillus sp. CBA3610 TaxID=2518176 RepID=UPI001595ABB1|nr:hypothetical protein [Lentibacillus sp. CBA3610]